MVTRGRPAHGRLGKHLLQALPQHGSPFTPAGAGQELGTNSSWTSQDHALWEPQPACLAAQGPGEGLPAGPAPLTTFLALTLRVRQMRSRMSCTGTVTGAPNSELERIEQGAPQRGVPSAALCLPPHSLTHLSMSPRQRASPENLCRSRRRVWASASSEGDSNVSAPGLSYCMGAGQTHSHLYLPPRLHSGGGPTHILPTAFCLELSSPPSLDQSPGPLTPPPAPERQPGPTCLCALVQAPEQAVQRGQQAAQLLLPAVRVLQALGEAGPQRRQPGVTLAGQLPEKGDPVRRESAQSWIPTPPAPRKMEVRAPGGEMEWKKGQKDTDGDWEAEAPTGVYCALTGRGMRTQGERQ